VRGRGREALRAGVAGMLAAAAVLLVLGGPVRGAGDGDGGGGGGAQASAAAAQGPTAAGRALFARMGCGSCHQLAAGAGVASVGPNLDEVLPTYTAAMLRAKIVDPYPAGASESFAQMPTDYGSRMSDEDLDALVGFLRAATRG